MIKKIIWPAAVLFVGSFACSFIFGYDLGIVAILIEEIIAFIFGAALVKQGKPGKYIWLNYLVWFFLLNAGNIAESMGWKP